jgi:hypothetical protein
MISKTTRPCIEVLAALLCPATASAQENCGTPSKRPAARQTPFVCAAATSPTQTRVEQCLRQNVFSWA